MCPLTGPYYACRFPMCVVFPHSEYYQQVRLPQTLLLSFGYASSPHTRPRGVCGSPKFLMIPLTGMLCPIPRRDLQCSTPMNEHLPWPSGQSTPSALGLSSHEAYRLHLRYGLPIALSTLHSHRYLRERKTRFWVRRLDLLPKWD